MEGANYEGSLVKCLKIARQQGMGIVSVPGISEHARLIGKKMGRDAVYYLRGCGGYGTVIQREPDEWEMVLTFPLMFPEAT